MARIVVIIKGKMKRMLSSKSNVKSKSEPHPSTTGPNTS